ncbi:MAG: protein-L-isoaspartate O-methyltransferase [Novosphingobium sp.]
MIISAQQLAPATDAARRAMIDSQLRPSGVNEPWVLAAMASVAREHFVPEPMRTAAYVDRAIALGEGRFLAAPLVHGRMLAEAGPRTSDRALLVGDGEGYLAALLRPLVGTLDSIEPSAVAVGGLSGRYSLILIDGAVEQLPAALAEALDDDGRLVTGMVERGVTRLATGRKASPGPAGEVALLPLSEIGIPVLPEFAAPKRWSF